MVDSKLNEPTAEGIVNPPGRLPERWTSPSTVSPALVWRSMALAWALAIFWLSTETFGPSFSRNMQGGILRFLHISLSAETFAMLHSITRKFAHLSEYGVLSFLLYRAIGSSDRTGWQPQLAFWSVLAAAAYSLSDEMHQLFVAGRAASLFDCGIDTTGAAISMLLVYAYFRAFRFTSKDCESARSAATLL